MAFFKGSAKRHREARFDIHRDSPTRRRASGRSTVELMSWAEATAMNMNYWVEQTMTKGNIDAVNEALLHNDALCALLLEIRTRMQIGVA